MAVGEITTEFEPVAEGKIISDFEPRVEGPPRLSPGIFTADERQKYQNKAVNSYVYSRMFDMTPDLSWEIHDQLTEKVGKAPRGPLAEIGSAIKAGGVGSAEMYLRAARVMGVDTTVQIEGIKKIADEMGPTRTGWIWDSLSGGITSSIMSVLGGIPGATIGLVGGPPGAVLGFAASAGTLFSLAEYDEFIEEAEALGIPREEVTDDAIISALAEGGIEAAQDILGAKIFRLLGTKPLTETAKRGLIQALKTFGKRTAQFVPIEVGGEMLTSAIQAKEREKVGIPTPPPGEAALQAVGPSLVQTLLMSVFGTGAGMLRGREVAGAPTKEKMPEEPIDVFAGGGLSPEETRRQREAGEWDRYLLTNDRVKEDGYGKGTEYEVAEPEGELITVYRAAPERVTTIDSGNYVTASRKYAERHLEDHITGRLVENPELTKGGHIISATLPKSDLGVSGANELIYVPAEKERKPSDITQEDVLELVTTGRAKEIPSDVWTRFPKMKEKADEMGLFGEYVTETIPTAVRPKHITIRQFFAQEIEREKAEKKKPRKAKSEILAFIAKAGGINPETAQGDITLFATKEKGYPRLIAQKGLTAEDMREKLEEAGYLDEGNTTEEMWEMIDREVWLYKHGAEIETGRTVAELIEPDLTLEEAIKRADREVQRYVRTERKEALQRAKEHMQELQARKKAKQEAREGIKKLGKIISRPAEKNIDFYYKEAIEILQAGIDPNFRAKKTLEQREQARQFLAADPSRLFDLPVPLIRALQKKALNEYTVAELQEIAAEVTRLRRLGKTKRMAKLAQEKRERERDIETMLGNILAGKPLKEVEEPIVKATAKVGKRKRAVSELRILTLRPSRIADILDRGKRFAGKVHKVFIDAVNKTEDAKLRAQDRRLKEGTAKLKELDLSMVNLSETRHVEGTAYTVDEIIDVYVGVKNPRKQLALIFGNNITPERSDKIIEALSPEEKALGDWLIDEYARNYARLREAYIDYTNEDMGSEVNYTPMRRAEIDYNDLKAEMADELLHRRALKKGYAPKGMTIARQDIPPEYQKPLFLGAFATWAEQVSKQEQFIQFGEITRRLHRIVNNPTFAKAIRQEFGQHYVEALRNYVSRVANPNIYRAFGKFEKISRMLRQHVAIAYLAGNVVTMGKQLPSLALYLGDVGPGRLLAASTEFISNPREVIDFVNERDPQMKHRRIERELEELKSFDKSSYERMIKTVGKVGMKGIYAIDRVAVTIGWKAVYDEHVTKLGEEEAIRKAQAATLRTQPAAAPKDLAEIYTTNEVLNWFLQFTNQLNNIWNIATHDLPSAIFQEKRYYDALWQTTGLFICSVVIWAMAHREFPDEPSDILKAVGEEMGNMIPLFGRRIVAGAQGWKNTDLPIAKDVADIARAIGAGKTEKAIKEGLELMAVVLGIPYIGLRRLYEAVAEEEPKRLLGGPKKKKTKIKW